MRIRRAVLSDLAEVVACEDLAFPRRNVNLRARDLALNSNLEPKIRAGSVHVIGPPGRILGYISLIANPNHLFVDAVGVLPEVQGQGLGSQLLAFAETVTLRLRLPSLRLFMDGSTSNHQFYRRRGYRETDRYEDGSFLRVHYMKVVAPHAPVAEARR